MWPASHNSVGVKCGHITTVEGGVRDSPSRPTEHVKPSFFSQLRASQRALHRACGRGFLSGAPGQDTRQEMPCKRFSAPGEVFGSPLGDDAASPFTPFWTKVDDVVGRFDDIQ